MPRFAACSRCSAQLCFPENVSRLKIFLQTTFCSQQSPHRVQSSTNLDLVDCVGSDLVLAMNNLDIGEQARAAATAAASASGSNAESSLFHGSVGDVDSTDRSSSPRGEGFLPLASLPPPPTSHPGWLNRAHSEPFSGRMYCSVGETSVGGNQIGNELRSESLGGSNGVRGSVGEDGPFNRDYFDYPRTTGINGNGSSSSRGSPRSAPPPGFGISGGVVPSSIEHGLPSRVMSSTGGSRSGLGGRRSLGGGSPGIPHLDESWTAVLNAPAGAEMMEFLTERASRALVLWNVEAIGEEDLRLACEAHGPLYYLRAEHQRKRVVFLAYYDVRDAVNAHQSLGAELSRLLMGEVNELLTDRFLRTANIDSWCGVVAR